MSGFVSFVTAFCTVCVLLGGLYMLCPKGSIAKAVRFVFCLVLLCSILNSVSGLSHKEFYVPPAKIQTADNEEATKTAAEMTFAKALQNAKITFSKVCAVTNKNADGSITIIEVTVYSKESRELINSVIGNPGEYTVRVIND